MHVGMDFFSPLQNSCKLLVLVDQYSRYPVTAEVQTEAARFVIPKMEAIFAQFRVPESIKSDNGPPFNGAEFSNYLKSLGVRHRKITPLAAESNGDVESFMKNVSRDLRMLLDFLRNYRTTPHSSTRFPPAQLLFGRVWRTKLPTAQPWTPMPDVHTRARENDQVAKQRMKANAENSRNNAEHRFKLMTKSSCARTYRLS